MLKHAVDWMQMGVTVVEGVLLFRVISLRLDRIYAFITRYCTLNLLFDVAAWYVGWDAPETITIFVYSLFFFAVLYPFTAYDTFEESKAQVAKLRRLQTIRLMSGLFITGICALVLGLSMQPTDAQGNSTIAAFMGVFLLTGSASACAAFLWFMYRLIRTQKIAIAHNTFVWAVFFIAALSLAIVNCVAVLIRPLIPAIAADIIGVILLSFDLALLTWCIIRLKAVPSDLASASEKASS
jgi:uncharacterized membrane-anchored protein